VRTRRLPSPLTAAAFVGTLAILAAATTWGHRPGLFAARPRPSDAVGDHCPRLIALDEAFVGIGERYKPDLFGLAVKFDLDLFMTGHDLWVTTDTVPMIARYDLYHDKVTRTTSALLILWDGEQLIDATAGY